MNEDELDRTDRAILRTLFNAGRPLSTKQVSDRIDLSPISTRKRLNKLEVGEFVERRKEGKTRNYITRKGTSVSSESKIEWNANYR